MDLTPAERKRRSELAKDLGNKVDPVTGRRLFGGPQKGAGRPKKVRVTEKLNEKIEQEADTIFETLKDALTNGNTKDALRAAKIMIDTAVKEIDYQRQEEKAVEEMTTEDLVEEIQSRVTKLSQHGDIKFDFDGEAEEIGEQREIESGL